ncbi:hypothetical protein BKA82DRAFT_2776771 [Pisolithus tinctorius]|nr:hypothetical protein BKA82DRAFT_2776771 [Pisolithus tinctorius]
MYYVLAKSASVTRVILIALTRTESWPGQRLNFAGTVFDDARCQSSQSHEIRITWVATLTRLDKILKNTISK